jgi:hypothetical protein
MVPLIFEPMISGAANLSVAVGAVRLLGAIAASENATVPAAIGVHVVFPSAICTTRLPTSAVPVRVGSGVVLGGVEIAV